MANEQLMIWNRTAMDYPNDTPVHELIEKQALVFPGKTAVRYAGKEISYQQLNESANRLAGVLLEHNIQKGDVVGLSVDRSHNMLIALLAILKTGAAYIPLDPEYPEHRIGYMLEDGGARLLLTSKKYRDRFSFSIKEVLLEDALERSLQYPAADLHKKMAGNDLAYIIYTSGSTGRPKGVMLEHSNLVNLLYSMMNFPVISEQDILLAVTTISFDIAALEMFLPLVAGATVVIADTMTTRDGLALLEKIKSENITLMQATPVTWRILLAAGWEENIGIRILCCGEALLPDLAIKLLSRCKALYNFYGPTETTIYSTGTQILPGNIITIGKPIGNTQVYILDEHQQRLPIGEAGEIYIGGDGVARGYKDLPDATAEHFLQDPFTATTRQRMYRTGDLAKWTPDGKIYFMGRMDQQVKIRGYRIELGEIETVLLAQPGTRNVVVTAREDTPGNKMLVAYIEPAKENFGSFDAATGPVDSWKRSLHDVLPAYMIPHEYVMMSSFPLLPNGKIDRNALPKPERNASHTVTRSQEAETVTEKLVAQVWAEALEIDEVGLDEDFFELGGHSLIAVQVMTRLEHETGKRLSIAALFESPTVRQLAHFLDAGDIATSFGTLVPVKPTGTKPPLYIVHGDGLNVMIFNSIAKHLDRDQPVLGLQPRGLDGQEKPDDNIEDIAAYYISEITKQNPAGPYFLAGYSFGGIVAFEMARQLQQAGRKVKLLAMFDTNVGNIEYVEPGIKRVWKKLTLQVPKLLFILDSLVKDPKSMLAYQWTVTKRKWNALWGRNTVMQEEGIEKLSPHEQEVVRKHIEAYEKYIMKEYDGRIDLFRVKKRVYFVQDPVYLGWEPWAGKGVVIHEVPGDHRTFLLPPNDRIFAAILQAVINERIKSE